MTSGSRARRLGLTAAVILLAALGAVLWLARDEPVRLPPGPIDSASALPSPPAKPPASPARVATAAPPPLTAADALSEALHEERVLVPSGAVIEGVETDRPWVCTGESMGLAARMGGAREPEAVYRWVWLTAGGRAELQPGPMLHWQAPAEAGSYVVRFQACKDLGGRRVGVLAEREVRIDVRRCGEGQGQDHEPLRLDVTQRGNGTFAFRALYQGTERIASYAWDFGDGTAKTTSAPEAEHTYAVQGLGPHEVKSFTVRLQARTGSGGALEATAFAATRGQPPAGAPPPVAVEVSRWRARPDGSGWQSDVVVRNASKGDVTWERFERLTLRWDGRVEVDSRKWSEAIAVEERLGGGSFRGHVTVSAAEAPPDVKQIIDVLYGHDAQGKPVEISWTPFKREPLPIPPETIDAPPSK